MGHDSVAHRKEGRWRKPPRDYERVGGQAGSGTPAHRRGSARQSAGCLSHHLFAPDLPAVAAIAGALTVAPDTQEELFVLA